MFKGLQKNQRRDRETETLVRPTQLIVDGSYSDKVVDFINDAFSEIRICAYAWRWYENTPEAGIQKINIELVKALQRGVTVRALTDQIATRDLLRRMGVAAHSLDTMRTLHTKGICIDQSTLIIGSHNLTKRAHQDNYEMSIATQEFEPIMQFHEYFDAMWRVADVG